MVLRSTLGTEVGNGGTSAGTTTQMTLTATSSQTGLYPYASAMRSPCVVLPAYESAMRSPVLTQRVGSPSDECKALMKTIVLRIRYALCTVLRSCYAMSGTDAAVLFAMRHLRDTGHAPTTA
eukprot:1100411-Rhodomonas_salina.1